MVATRMPINGKHGAPAGNVAEKGESVAQFQPIAFGPEGGLAHRIVIAGSTGRRLVSPRHDVPLYGPDGLVACVCTTPAGSWARYEVADNEPFNPLRLVRRHSVLRDGARRGRAAYGGSNLAGEKKLTGDLNGRTAPRGGSWDKENLVNGTVPPGTAGWEKVRMLLAKSVKPGRFSDNAPWNVGVLPQTWDDSAHLSPASQKLPGGLVEVVDFGLGSLRKPGEVYLVKPLAALGVEEEGGTSWKIVAVAADDPTAPLLENTFDVHLQLPGMLELIQAWAATCLVGGKGARKCQWLAGSTAVKKSPARDKIAQLHDAWTSHANHRMRLDQPSSKDPSTPLTAGVLEKIWNRYTAKDSDAVWGPIPSSCPPLRSGILFDVSWFEPQPRLRYIPCPESLPSGLCTPVGSVDSDFESQGGSFSGRQGQSRWDSFDSESEDHAADMGAAETLSTASGCSASAKAACSPASQPGSPAASRRPMASPDPRPSAESSSQPDAVTSAKVKRGLSGLLHRSGAPEYLSPSKVRHSMWSRASKSQSKAAVADASQTESKFKDSKLTRANTEKTGKGASRLGVRPAGKGADVSTLEITLALYGHAG